MEYFVHIVFTDGTSRHTQNSASAAWVIYIATGQVLSSRGISLQLLTKMLLNIVSSLSYCMMLFHMAFILLRYVLTFS